MSFNTSFFSRLMLIIVTVAVTFLQLSCAMDASDVVHVTGVKILEPQSTDYGPGTLQLRIAISPANATNKNVSYSSADTSIATISDTGFVNAVTLGLATFSVTTEDGEFTDSVTVSILSSGFAMVE